MSNWFENNPTKSIIAYTLTILVAAYASAYFILHENKERRHNAEKENLNIIIQTQRERINLLEYENDNLRNEIKAQTEILQSIPGTTKYYEEKIATLKKSIADKDTSYQNIGNSINTKYIIESDLIDIGHAFVDNLTGTSIGINSISIDRDASGVINLPNRPEIKFSKILAGQRWQFTFEKRNFEIIILELNWVGNKYRVKIIER